MYAALKERAALGVCYEEQRWEAYAARGHGDEGANDDGTQLDVTPGSNVASATGDGSEEAREVAGSNPGGGERLDGESSALSSPPTPAVSREEDQPPGSLDATLDDDAMND